MTRTLVRLAVACCCAALLAGCGSSATDADQPNNPRTATQAPVQVDVDGIPALTGNPTDLDAPAQALAGGAQPPTQLVTRDIVVGTGEAATASDTVDVRYVGTLYTDGTLFDSSWRRGPEPISFPLSGVVPGFAKGIEGMKPGGRRVIVIPPDLGYGARGQGPIPANSTLVFVVDLVGIG
ncbi:FKBP-type peptidyl-prolyl cis-trans isomerase [Pseudonocardia sp.]|uniref:FKBP-type peptidyl-prolyl cis-trans isomerase n=1 Tax=Pseudonocardia sp. TaxID=60912 RepID=UPI003D13D0DF